MEHKRGWVAGMGPTNFESGGFYSTYKQVGEFDEAGTCSLRWVRHRRLVRLLRPVRPVLESDHHLLNVMNIPFSFFTLVLFLIVRCP